MKIKRNILLNPGPSTTTDTVKLAQVVPDICPREKEFAGLMKGLRRDLLKVAHAPADEYTAVLFCGSGTINIDICIYLMPLNSYHMVLPLMNSNTGFMNIQMLAIKKDVLIGEV